MALILAVRSGKKLIRYLKLTRTCYSPGLRVCAYAHSRCKRMGSCRIDGFRAGEHDAKAATARTRRFAEQPHFNVRVHRKCIVEPAVNRAVEVLVAEDHCARRG